MTTTRIGPTTFAWGARTYVMGILNVTPGLVLRRRPARRDRPGRGRRSSRRAGWSPRARTSSISAGSRPGPVTSRSMTAAEAARVVPVVAAVRAALPATPISIDTTKPAVAAAALDAGADLINDVWGVGPDDGLARLAAARRVPMVVMHNRARGRLRGPHGRGRRRPAGGAGSRDRARGRAGRPHRRSRVRVRQDRRAQPGPPPRPGSAAVARSARSCSGRAASPRWDSSWTCPPTSVSRPRSRRPPSGSPRARISCGCTMYRPTSAPPGCPMRSSAGRGTARQPPGGAR